MVPVDRWKCICNRWYLTILRERCLTFVVVTMPADALAPLGARPSAGTVMTEVLSHICMGPAMERVNIFLRFQKFRNLRSFWCRFYLIISSIDIVKCYDPNGDILYRFSMYCHMFSGVTFSFSRSFTFGMHCYVECICQHVNALQTFTRNLNRVMSFLCVYTKKCVFCNTTICFWIGID